MRGLSRNRRSVAIDLKQDAGRDLLLRLGSDADVLVEGFRPGVLERLGLGPDVLLGANPGLVVARVTVRTNLDQLIGGATEETVLARVGQAIVSAIGSADTSM